MPVSGFEQHTWQCSGCSTVEQRRTFIREKMTIQTVPLEPAKIRLMGSTEIVPAQPTQAILVEPIETVSAESTQTVLAKSIKAEPVEPTRIVPPPHPEPTLSMSNMNARAKALDDKLRNLKERAKAAREAVGQTGRPKFNRDLDNKSCSAPLPSALSETSSHVKPHESLRVASLAPVSYDEPNVPGSNGSSITDESPLDTRSSVPTSWPWSSSLQCACGSGKLSPRPNCSLPDRIRSVCNRSRSRSPPRTPSRTNWQKLSLF
jgi:hypothetical protein